MSSFAWPNASRLLLRAYASKTSTASTTVKIPFASSRWLSGYASRNLRLGPGFSPRCQTVFSLPKTPYCNRRTLFSDRTIQKYEDLPKDYRDQIGIAFRNLDLTDSEVIRIFGRGVNPKRANHLLRILHGRRVAGTLDDPAFAVHTAQFTKDQVAKALEYLRKSIPVDEVMNAGLRAEDELAQMEHDAETAEQAKDTIKPETETKAYTADPVYGHSKLDEIRARNIAKRKAHEAELEEKRQAAEINSGTLAEVRPQKREIANPRIAEYYKNAQSELDAPPELKAWERILPSATVVALVIGFLAALSTVYDEPAAHYRIFPAISTAHATVGAIIAANALVYLAWRVPPLWSVLNKYMIMVVATVKPVTMFTASFSHQKLGHVILNMVPLWFIGTALHEDLSRAEFLTLYTACGAVGFVGALATYTLRGLIGVTTMGASGATLGIYSAYFYLHRNDGFRFMGLPEDGVHGIIFLALLLVPQLAGFGKTAALGVDFASHVFGMLTGIAGMEMITRYKEKGESKQVFDVISGTESQTKVEDSPSTPS